MFEIAQYLQRVSYDAMPATTFDVSYKTHATSIMLVTWIVETLFLRCASQRLSIRRWLLRLPVLHREWATARPQQLARLRLRLQKPPAQAEIRDTPAHQPPPYPGSKQSCWRSSRGPAKATKGVARKIVQASASVAARLVPFTHTLSIRFTPRRFVALLA